MYKPIYKIKIQVNFLSLFILNYDNNNDDDNNNNNNNNNKKIINNIYIYIHTFIYY